MVKNPGIKRTTRKASVTIGEILPLLDGSSLAPLRYRETTVGMLSPETTTSKTTAEMKPSPRTGVLSARLGRPTVSIERRVSPTTIKIQ